MPIPPDITGRIPLRTRVFTGFFETDTGFLRSVRVGETEVLRAVYGAVRDENWDTVPPECTPESLTQGEDHFELVFNAVCRLGSIRYVWRGEISGRANGLRFRFDGRAESRFRRNRIGICVLHPVAECVGQPCRVRRADGTWREQVFPDFISPHQPFQDLSALAWRPAGRFAAELEFAGEVFETEDQRNWTDASFKTYGTPLARPFPVPVAPGDEVHQAVRLTLAPDAGAAARPSAAAPGDDEAPPVTVRVDPGHVVGRLPDLGLGLGRGGGELAPWQEEQLRALRLDHLRVDLPLDRPDDWRERLREARRTAARVGTRLQCALFLSDQAAAELTAFRAAVGPEEVARCLVFHRAEKSTSARWHQLAHEVLAPHGYRLATGTDAYFTEVNRERPPRDAAVCYSFNPQVHAFDDRSVMETLEAQPDTVRSAEQFCDGDLVLSPITLLPRFNPNATGGTAPTPAADPRQRTGFGAAWTAGTLAGLAPRPRVASLTFYEVAGGHGVMAREAAEVYPVFHVFRALAGVRDLLAASVSAPSRLRVLAGHRAEGGELVCLVVNPTPDGQTVEFSGPAGRHLRRESLGERSPGRSPAAEPVAAGRDGAPARFALDARSVAILTGP